MEKENQKEPMEVSPKSKENLESIITIEKLEATGNEEETVSMKKTTLGHQVITYRVRLYDRHFSWLQATRELYLRLVRHFVFVLQQQEELLKQSDFLLLRTLEIQCIGTKEKKAAGVLPDYPLVDFPKIPLYFRRSAINTAIDLARKGAEEMQPHLVLYQGMYRNFTDRTIELKLFQGERWVWVTYPFTGRPLPQEAKRLSPLLVIEKRTAWLDLPFSFAVTDFRTVNERMETEQRICAVVFPDGEDILAAAVILSREGTVLEEYGVRGGKKKEELRRQVLAHIQISEKSRGRTVSQKMRKENAVWYTKLQNRNHWEAHRISRQILEYCVSRQIKVIVVPKYDTGAEVWESRSLKADGFRWLGRSMIRTLKYKAFQQGIVVTSVRPYALGNRCSVCGEPIKKYQERPNPRKSEFGGILWECPNGHRGNAAFNLAKNLGKKFLAYYPLKKEE